MKLKKQLFHAVKFFSENLFHEYEECATEIGNYFPNFPLLYPIVSDSIQRISIAVLAPQQE